MPFDFYNYKPYCINYSNLFDEQNSNKILDDPLLQTQYLTAWFNLIMEHDDSIVNQLSTQKAILEYKNRLNSEPQIFQHPLNFSNTQVLLHFRASRANEIITLNKPKSSLISIDEFIEKDSIYRWNPVNTNVSSYSSNNTPIIILPFYSGQYELLVIDGNHRLTYKTQNKIPKIAVLIISEQSVIKFSLFSSSFDKFYYIMNNEFYYMINEKHHYKTNDNDLIQKSYLNGGTLKFNEVCNK